MGVRRLPDYTCKGCGCTFRPRNANSQFHSQRCFIDWRGKQPEWAEKMARCGRACAASKRQARLALVRDKVCGLTAAQAYWLGQREGYIIGHKAGMRAGHAKGYEQALRDASPAYARALEGA